MDSSIISEESDHLSHEHTHDEEGSKMFGFIVFLLSQDLRNWHSVGTLFSDGSSEKKADQVGDRSRGSMQRLWERSALSMEL